MAKNFFQKEQKWWFFINWAKIDDFWNYSNPSANVMRISFEKSKECGSCKTTRNDSRSRSDHGFSGVWVIFRPRKCTHSALSNKCYLTPNKASFAIKWSFLPQIPYRKYSLNHGSITQWASFIHMHIFMYICTVELGKQLELYYTSNSKITQGNWD